jgi:outer membrane receptor protein involved in Fe transport
MNINRTQDFSISLTKVWERHTIKAGFYLNHSYKAQNLGAGGGASFQGNISFANDTANPLDTGFGFANAALGVFTNYQQQSKFVEGSFIYNQVDWYVQDNWKVNSKLTLDYGLRFVNQQPHTVPVLEPGSGIRDPGRGSGSEVRTAGLPDPGLPDPGPPTAPATTRSAPHTAPRRCGRADRACAWRWPCGPPPS